jgi:hypothetical protein
MELGHNHFLKKLHQIVIYIYMCVCVCARVRVYLFFGEGVTTIICIGYNIEEFCGSVSSIKSKYVGTFPTLV